MQKGMWVWWEPDQKSRPKWMIDTQKMVAATVVRVKGNDVEIEGLTPARQSWAKVVPASQVYPRGGG